MFSKLHLLILLFLLLGVSVINGCYTVVMHQKNIALPADVETGSAPEIFSHSIDISNQSSCTSCHTSEFNYEEIGSAGSTFGHSSLWGYYYETNIPWWATEGQNEEYAEEEDSTDADEPGTRRHYGRRRAALNNDNASSSITTTTDVTSGGTAVIPSIPLSTPSFGGAITVTVEDTAETHDSNDTEPVKTENPDSVQTGQSPAKTESQNKKRDYGVRRNVKKK